MEILSVLVVIAIVVVALRALAALLNMWRSPKKKRSGEVIFDDITFDELQRIMVSYGELLGWKDDNLIIRDETCLPASKEVIKKGLHVSMLAARTVKEREDFKVAYLFLSSFLPNVGPEGISLPIEDLKNFTEILSRQSIENIDVVKEKVEKCKHWLEKSLKEQKKLEEELKALEPQLSEISPRSTSKSQLGEIETVEISKIKPWSIQQNQLSAVRMIRIQMIHKIFHEVDNISLEKRIEDFDRDLNVENEIDIWEKMAEAYTKYTSKHELTLEEKREVYHILLSRSMAPEDWVLKNHKSNVFSNEKVKEIMGYYKR